MRRIIVDLVVVVFDLFEMLFIYLFGIIKKKKEKIK